MNKMTNIDNKQRKSMISSVGLGKNKKYWNRRKM